MMKIGPYKESDDIRLVYSIEIPEDCRNPIMKTLFDTFGCRWVMLDRAFDDRFFKIRLLKFKGTYEVRKICGNQKEIIQKLIEKGIFDDSCFLRPALDEIHIEFKTLKGLVNFNRLLKLYQIV